MSPKAMKINMLLCLSFLVSLCLVASSQNIVNPVSTRPSNSSLRIHVRKFAQLPKFRNRPNRIVSTTHQGNDLYIVTNINGHIYKVSRTGQVTLWFNANTTLFMQTGREMDFSRFLHGGLRSIAFHPQFRKNRLIYTAYMEKRGSPDAGPYLSRPRVPMEADTVIAEWRVGQRSGRPIPSSFREVMRIGMPVYDHTVREMRFLGKFLYIGHGDGGAQNNTLGGGQRNDGLGKILRIDPLRTSTRQYSVPRSNPFVRNRAMLDEIYAIGFRNPHNLCFSKQRELFVVDVGRDNIEEVNIVKKGGNYGWSRREGPFVHLEGDGGILTGIAPLPKNDRRFGFIYPNAIVGHFGERGAGFVFQALTGSCPIENGSDLDGLMLYANFPSDGKVYYSTLNALRGARVTGAPESLTQAKTFVPKILFDHDGNARTPMIEVDDLRSIVRSEKEFADVERVDVRFGQGRRGEIYWTSKQNGGVYVITNSKPKRRKMRN